jgi:hypothetical protein
VPGKRFAVAEEPGTRSASRAAANESTFRAANEQLAEKVSEFGLADERTPYICECEEERCTTIVRLTISEYESIRSRPRQFLLAPAHQGEDDRIVAEQAGYTIVEKTGEEGRLVEAQDPRS